MANLQEFLMRAMSDAELQGKLMALMQETPQDMIKDAIAIAKTYGYDITTEEIQSFLMAQMAAMPQNEMAKKVMDTVQEGLKKQ